jgi:hypothetical protein
MSLYTGSNSYTARCVTRHVDLTRKFLGELKAADWHSTAWHEALGGLIVTSQMLTDSAEALAAELKEPKA